MPTQKEDSRAPHIPLINNDGDGMVSLLEFQPAHEKSFKPMDVDKDGILTFEQIQDFMRGTSLEGIWRGAIDHRQLEFAMRQLAVKPVSP